MPRVKKSIPAYQFHKPTGQINAWFTIGGTHRVIYLGRYNSPGSRVEYRHEIAELETPTPSGANGWPGTGHRVPPVAFQQ